MNAGTIQKSPGATLPGQVRDIMQHNVVTVSPDAMVHELADVLLKEEVSGVPVIGKDGLVAGVVSLWDIVGLAAKEGRHPEMIWMSEGQPGASGQAGYYGTLLPERPVGAPILRTIRPPLLERYRVREIMTPAIFHVSEDMTIPDLARYLLASRIHRALVMDHGRLLGIVTTTDVLEAVAGLQAGV